MTQPSPHCTPTRGQLVTFVYCKHLPARQGYVVRCFKSGDYTIHGLHPNGRGRRYHVQAHEVLEVHPEVKLHEQTSLL